MDEVAFEKYRLETREHLFQFLFSTDLYLPANYVHEKENQNEIQIFTEINSCFVSFSPPVLPDRSPLHYR